jgi:hypothetical protein
MENRIEAKDAEKEVSQKGDDLNLNSITKCSDQSASLYKCDTNNTALHLPNFELGGLGSTNAGGKELSEKLGASKESKDQSKCRDSGDDDDDEGDEKDTFSESMNGEDHSAESMSGKDQSGRNGKNQKHNDDSDLHNGKDSISDAAKKQKNSADDDSKHLNESFGGGIKQRKESLEDNGKYRKDSPEDGGPKGLDKGREGKGGKGMPDLYVEPDQGQFKEYSKKGNGDFGGASKSQKERFGKTYEGELRL